MTSSEGSGTITHRQGPRIRNEEEEEQVIPVRSSTTPGDGRVGTSPAPASKMFGFGSVSTDPDDDSRPITRKEFSRFRRTVEKTFKELFADLTGRMAKNASALYAQIQFQQGALEGSREQHDKKLSESLATMQNLSNTVEVMSRHLQALESSVAYWGRWEWGHAKSWLTVGQLLPPPTTTWSAGAPLGAQCAQHCIPHTLVGI